MHDSDANGDGVIDWIANSGLTDANNNGTPDEWEKDTDGDGIADVHDSDANGDGVIDWIANSGLTDANNNGTPDEWEKDTDGDGIAVVYDSLQKVDNQSVDNNESSIVENINYSNISISNQKNQILNFNCYPNIFTDFINVEFTTEVKSNVMIEIYAANGALLNKQNIQTDKGLNKINVNTENFEKGYYLISISIENGETRVRKVLK